MKGVDRRCLTREALNFAIQVKKDKLDERPLTTIAGEIFDFLQAPLGAEESDNQVGDREILIGFARAIIVESGIRDGSYKFALESLISIRDGRISSVSLMPDFGAKLVASGRGAALVSETPDNRA